MANTPKCLQGISDGDFSVSDQDHDRSLRPIRGRRAKETTVFFIPQAAGHSPVERLEMDFSGLGQLLARCSESDLHKIMLALVDVGVRINEKDAIMRNMWPPDLLDRIKTVQQQHFIYLLLSDTDTAGPRTLLFKKAIVEGSCPLEVASMFGVQFSRDDVARMQIDSSKIEELEQFGLVDADFQYAPEIPESSRISEVVEKVRRITANLHRLPKKVGDDNDV